jgi:hypothetical protein
MQMSLPTNTRTALPPVPDDQILDAMLLLARATRPHRILVAGSSAPDVYLGLLQRGFTRAATPATSRFPCGQHDVALLVGHHSIQALEGLIDRVVPYLSTRASLAIWIGSHELMRGRPLQIELERLGFRVDAGTRCETGFILSAERQQMWTIAQAS